MYVELSQFLHQDTKRARARSKGSGLLEVWAMAAVFHGWSLPVIQLKPGMAVADVGSGTGLYLVIVSQCRRRGQGLRSRHLPEVCQASAKPY